SRSCSVPCRASSASSRSSPATRSRRAGTSRNRSRSAGASAPGRSSSSRSRRSSAARIQRGRQTMSGSDEDASGAFEAAISRAHAAWPAGWVPAASFVEHLRTRLPAEGDPAEALPALAVEDLYLAFACALGVPAALEAFARTILVEVDAHV